MQAPFPLLRWSAGAYRRGPARRRAVLVPCPRMSEGHTLTVADAAREVGVKPDTLRRWAKTGVIPGVDGGDSFPRSAVATARIVKRLRERGHSLQELRKASQDGRLAYGFLEELFPAAAPAHTLG